MEIIHFASQRDAEEYADIMSRARRVEYDIAGRAKCGECYEFHYADEPHGKTTERRKPSATRAA